MNILIHFKCPYCHREQETTLWDVKDQHHHFYTVYCDQEQGGCDSPITLSVRLKPVVDVYKLESVE